jgi:hypothetical protein
MKQLRCVALFSGLAMFAAAAMAAPGENEIVPADQIKWEKGPLEGTQLAALWGDRNKGGPYGVLVKFKAGLMHPLHSHPHDLRTVILSGTFVFQPEGGKEVKLGPGSFLRQAGGKKHISGCSKDGDCEFVMTSSDKFDFIPAEKPAGAEKAEAKKEMKKEEKKDEKK